MSHRLDNEIWHEEGKVAIKSSGPKVLAEVYKGSSRDSKGEALWWQILLVDSDELIHMKRSHISRSGDDKALRGLCEFRSRTTSFAFAMVTAGRNLGTN
ncbi:hypothetical protein AB6A40_001886 [Gnathostoma spinigerum]|uniref:Uncharacterized protein n=1 Tax=Gnathostoma spinigerum TaxID=75299 RepID=A0ABD6E7E0_9BILA